METEELLIRGDMNSYENKIHENRGTSDRGEIKLNYNRSENKIHKNKGNYG